MTQLGAPGGRVRLGLRWLLAGFYLTGGVFHLLRPQPFLTITPQWVPAPDAVVLLTGLAELVAVPALLQPWSRGLRQAAGFGLALYAVCVYPANVNHLMLDLARPGHGWGLWYHVPRLLAQPLIVWLALWTGEVVAWPFGAKRLAL